ncbi:MULTISPECIES: ABC transporter substrate-binding protein [Micrococcaceae]|uniref:ABC transporter substrate-binding protein n=1 Tax=Micrococcaceae TaxID=1268 RepID=UPI001CFF806A|nr:MULTISPECIES: ABC transporter substrate-binding protein [Micrococcaceae]MCB5283704.1 Glutathione-binding protein GsiB [Arthrobacter sp. ES1]MDJ0354023.1 ABC transporter substrate-binding protein [Pseudarthrobacter sp. PH31-O2]WGZ80879.1 ABC transporter substrate-binding protein [Arthrobacter sp. EM1]
MRKTYGVIAAIAATALALTGCGASQPTSGTSTDTLTMSNSGDITSWDPSAMKEGSIIQYAEAMYDPLLKKSADGSIEGNLATKWSYNSDLTELTLTLRDGIKFADGTAFDADAVKANLEDRKKGAGSASETAKAISKVDTLSPTEVKIDLAAPAPGLLAALATYAGFMASPKAIAAGTIGKTPVGSGPYTLDTKTVAGTSYVFNKKPEYWDKDSYPFSTVVIKPMPDFTAAYNALSTGQTEFMYATADMADQAKAAGLTVQTVPGEWQGIILQDRAGTLVPALKDERVRQAINIALDRKAILDGFFHGYGQVSTQTFNPASQAWVSELNDKYPYDVAKAKKLLADAGYADGFTLPVVYSSGFQEPLIPILQQYLAAVGITLKPVLAGSFANGGLKVYNDSAAYILSFSTNIPAWTDVLNKLTPTSLWNGLGYSDPTVQKYLDEIPKAQGDGQAKLYQELNTYIVDKAWFAPIATLQNVYISSSKIKVTMEQAQLVPSLRFFAPAGK